MATEVMHVLYSPDIANVLVYLAKHGKKIGKEEIVKEFLQTGSHLSDFEEREMETYAAVYNAVHFLNEKGLVRYTDKSKTNVKITKSGKKFNNLLEEAASLIKR